MGIGPEMMEILDAMLRGGVIAAAALMGLLFTRRSLSTPIGLFGLLQAVAIIGYVLCTAHWHDKYSPFWWASTTVCHFIPLFFWLFARAVFHDISRIGQVEKTVSAIFSAFVLAYILSAVFPDLPISKPYGELFRLIGLAFGLYVMFDVAREYGNDLIERRRKVRLYLVGALGTLYVMLVVNNILIGGSRPSGLAALIILAALLILSTGLTLLITRLRRDLFPLETAENLPGSHEKEAPTPSSDDGPSFDPNELEAVVQAMEVEKAYRDETLTIVTLAKRLGTQEYRLRRAINQGLGQRNFTSFLNGYRLREIEKGLSDASKARTPILTLALEAGFNSIGPFNRAFKEKHGITPKAFRQKTLRPDASG